jgi:ring-1,2-phenylacetyl-CoA epoxidase subunit PaaD
MVTPNANLSDEALAKSERENLNADLSDDASAVALAKAERSAWSWLEEIMDPEIPVLSICDLGIVRNVHSDGAELVVTITPTYSGCPAMAVITDEIRAALQKRGIARFRIETQLSPAWTTDWLSEKGREGLRKYGIAPPASCRAAGPAASIQIVCPHCGSDSTRLVSQFGSTPCKAIYVCDSCREPFDYFKCH